MDNELAREVGQRVRHARQANRQTQAVVAGLSGVTTDYLYQIERGKKLPALPVLLALAAALRLTPADLLASPRSSGGTAPITKPPDATALHQAMLVPEVSGAPVDGSALHRRIHDAWATWQQSPTRYSQLGQLLPRLITDTEAYIRQSHNAASGYERAVELYGLVRTVGKRLGRLDVALLAADRAMRAAEHVEQPLSRAAASWNLAHVLMADGHANEAETVAMRAHEALQRRADGNDLDALAMQGALLSVASVASTRLGDPWRARDRLRDADRLGRVTGERNTAWTAFGPTNVAMHAVSVEVETGEVGEALRLADSIDPPQTLSIERRVAFLLEQAKGYNQRQDYGSALVALQAASADAPEDVRYRPAAHLLLHAVVQRGRSTTARQGAALASRLGIAF